MYVQTIKLGCVALAVLTFFWQGCDQLTEPNKATPTAAKTKQPRVYIHRFVLTHDGGVAFDTQTGQICKTWDWQPMGKQAKPDASGNLPQRAYGEFAPTCLSLYENYPSGVDIDLETSPPGIEGNAP